MNNFIKRFSLLICALLLTVSISGGFAQAAETTQADACDYNSLHTCPESSLRSMLIKLEAESSEQQAKIKALTAEIKKTQTSINSNITGDYDVGKQKTASSALTAKEAELKKQSDAYAQLNEEKILPIKVELNSRNTAGLKGILTIQGQGMFTNLATFLGDIIDFLIKFVGSVALILLVIGGVRLVVAAGNDNSVQNAKQMITYAIIGLAVALLAYIIVTFVHGLLYR